MKIPFYRPSITDAEINEVIDTLHSEWLTTGPKTKLFENEFSTYMGHAYSLALNSCTAALHLALEAVGIKENQSVVVPSMTFAATAEVVRYFNARPLLVDCMDNDFNIDVEDTENRIERAIEIGEQVTAIIPVHYGGHVCDMEGVLRLAQKYDLRVIEDAAHCCPAYYRENESDQWKQVGTDGEISCYSFYANKTITTGEGGMVCTNDRDLYERMQIMSLHGISRDAWKRFSGDGSWYYEIIAPGFKYNLTDVASSIGLHQLRRADILHKLRSERVKEYEKHLGDVDEIILPRQMKNRIHSWHLYVIRLKLSRLSIDRAEFITKLKEKEIGCSVHWMPLHMHPYYRELYGYKPDDIPVAASLYKEIISLPLYPDMTNDEVKYVADSIKDVIARNRK
jgi:dTDP-4-amino-4,6-dideoxygalactose transaminase